jgi:hypothetical protein
MAPEKPPVRYTHVQQLSQWAERIALEVRPHDRSSLPPRSLLPGPHPNTSTSSTFASPS